MTYWMLMRKGRVQNFGGRHALTGEPARFLPVASTFEDAKRLADWMGDKDIRPAQIGSVEGETLSHHISLSIEQGCVATYCVDGWNNDGSPRWCVLHQEA